MCSKLSNSTNLCARLKDNNIHFVSVSQNSAGVPCFFVYAEVGCPTPQFVGCEIAINVQQGGKVTLKAWSETEYLVPLVIQAVSFVLTQDE